MPQKQEEKPDHGKTLASWSFPEYIKHQRSTSWYVGFFIIVIGLITYSIFTANVLFALIIIITVIILVFSAQREPLNTEFKITEDGIKLSENFYPYKDIKNFWIVYEPPEIKSLYLDFKSVIRPCLSIPLEKENPLEIRKILLTYLEEDLTKESETFSDYIKRTLKL